MMKRRKALDLNPLAVDHLAGVDGAAAALGATSTATLPSDAAWADDPGELGDVVRDLGAVLMEAMRVRRQRRRHPPDARGEHVGSAATVVGLHGSGKKPRAHPTWDHRGGLFDVPAIGGA
jgi:hypothetical protein